MSIKITEFGYKFTGYGEDKKYSGYLTIYDYGMFWNYSFIMRNPEVELEILTNVLKDVESRISKVKSKINNKEPK